MQLPYKPSSMMTVGEFKNKLKGVPNDTPLFVVVDTSEDNYDENYRLLTVHPIDHLEREWTLDENMEGDELSILIHLNEDFYSTYKITLKN